MSDRWAFESRRVSDMALGKLLIYTYTYAPPRPAQHYQTFTLCSVCAPEAAIIGLKDLAFIILPHYFENMSGLFAGSLPPTIVGVISVLLMIPGTFVAIMILSDRLNPARRQRR